MYKYISIFSILCTVLLSACNSADKSIVLFFDNDVHCKVEGYPYFAGLRDAVSTDTAYVGMVSSGDFIQGGTIGSISKGEAITAIMKNIGYDAVALGNHEFDYDVQHILNLTGDIDAPVVCANLVDNDGKTVFPPYRVVNYGNKKVAFLGVTTPNTLYARKSAFEDINGNMVYDFCRYNLYEVVQKYVDDARKEADYVIVLSHVGESSDSIGINSNDMIRATSGIDALLDGHTHNTVAPFYINDKDGRPVLVAQTGMTFMNAGKLVIGRDGKVSAELIPVFDGNVEAMKVNERIKNVVDSVTDYYANITEMPVGESDFALAIEDADGNNIVRCKNSNAGDFVSDAIREFAQTDVAMVNGGGIRNSLPAGKLKRGDVIAMCPYDNSICSFTLKGSDIINIVNACIKSLPYLNGNFPQVSGMKFRIVVDTKGNYIKDVKIFDEKTNKYKDLVADKDYTMATTTYYVTSEQFESMRGRYREYVDHHVTYTDAVVDYIKNVFEGKVPDRYKTPDGRMSF